MTDYRRTTYQYAGLETTIWVMANGGEPGTAQCSFGNPGGTLALGDRLCVKRLFGSGGDLLRTTDAHGATTRFWANPQGNVALIQDPAGNKTGANYNALGQRTDLYDPNMGHWGFVYNGLGEVLIQTDAQGQSTTFSYDPLGRLIRRVAQNADPELGAFDDTWVYDAPGQEVCSPTNSAPRRSSAARRR